MIAETCEWTYSPGDTWKKAFGWSAWILPWVLLIFHLHTFWTLAPDYEYGWVVLPLGVYLLSRRWTGLEANPAGQRGAGSLAVVCAILILPVWWVRAAVPDWSVINYALTLTVIGYTLALVAGRTSWGTAWALAFPIFFILCAVPWPQRAENAVIQTLTKFVAAGAVEALQWMGIGAARQGNLISLANTTVGISDACSGIRSLQSVLVSALALGEIYALRLSRRFALVGASVAMALALNLLRNIILAFLAASSGPAALEHWHDRAGWAILLLSLPLLFLTARRWRNDPPTVATSGIHLPPLPTWSAVTLTIWFCAVAGGVEGWYRVHEFSAINGHRMEVRWPKEKANFANAPIDDRTRDMLLSSEAQGASWTEEDGTRWHLTFMTWAPGRTSAQSARVHRPEVCWQAAGAEFQGKQPAQPIAVSGGELLFEPLTFRAGNEAVYVFYALYEEANHDDPHELFQSRWSRIGRAFHGQRNLGQQTAEISLRGFTSYESALEAVTRKLPALVALRQSN